ncbi:HNH endonuclease signature motif containing protein, partial [Nocardioides sp.]|uniref:HNH endonuclease signature motif containing protein n=1 Tax=Nocardioides sp. TaxID=35761 RepID=UPI0039E673B7
LDLTAEAATAGRFATDTLREQVVETARKCVFPYCQRTAEACDMDHGQKWRKDGPPGQNRASNIAPLCRQHHRIKTHSTGWTYYQLSPGEYLWTSPHGYRFHTTRHGTREITNPDEDPG